MVALTLTDRSPALVGAMTIRRFDGSSRPNSY
jgi:hypothetical protein